MDTSNVCIITFWYIWYLSVEGYTGFLPSCFVCRIGVKPDTPLITQWVPLWPVSILHNSGLSLLGPSSNYSIVGGWTLTYVRNTSHLELTQDGIRASDNLSILSNLYCTRSYLLVSDFFLQLPLCNLLKSGDQPIMKMYLEQCRQAMLQLHLSDQQVYCLLRCDLY